MHYRLFFLSMFLIYLIYGLVFVGFLSTVPKYVYIWNFVVQLGLCLFLLLRYHPFRTAYKFDFHYDAKLIFGASFLLLINLLTIPFMLSQWNRVTSYVGLDNIEQIPIKTLTIRDVIAL